MPKNDARLHFLVVRKVWQRAVTAPAPPLCRFRQCVHICLIVERIAFMIHDLSPLVPYIIVIGSIAQFFTNLMGDLTPFAYAAGAFYFGWGAIQYMAAGETYSREIAQAKHRMYAPLGGIS